MTDLVETEESEKIHALLDDVFEIDGSECNCRPPASDFGYKPKRRKKGKYLKDWE